MNRAIFRAVSAGASCLWATVALAAGQAGARGPVASLPPIYRSFYVHPDFDRAPAAGQTRPELPPAAPAPKLVAFKPLSQVAPLEPSAIPQARQELPTAITALKRGEALSDPQAQAVSALAKSAFEAKDVLTLAQMALLISRPADRGLQDLFLQALKIIKYRPLTLESRDAEQALRTFDRRGELSNENRAWMASQVGERLTRTYLQTPY